MDDKFSAVHTISRPTASHSDILGFEICNVLHCFTKEYGFIWISPRLTILHFIHLFSVEWHAIWISWRLKIHNIVHLFAASMILFWISPRLKIQSCPIVGYCRNFMMIRQLDSYAIPSRGIQLDSVERSDPIRSDRIQRRIVAPGLMWLSQHSSEKYTMRMFSIKSSVRCSAWIKLDVIIWSLYTACVHLISIWQTPSTQWICMESERKKFFFQLAQTDAYFFVRQRGRKENV
jgi:hypothetical protein